VRPFHSLIARTATASIPVLALAACSSPGSLVSTGSVSQTFTCCSASDISPVRHPGETVRLHWIATPLEPSASSQVGTVRLEARLSGPFPSVSALKAADGPATITAPVIVATDMAGGAPVSVLRIPKDAPAGYYNLTTTVSQEGGQFSGGSVITVAAK
jgi:hypothetical protein